jgi:hypothetical protein
MKQKSPTLNGLIASSVLYIAFILAAAIIAMIENLPAEPVGMTSSAPAWQGFLYGNGTAMSPPLYWLVAQAALTALAPKRGAWGVVGVAGLVITGLLFSIFGALEPIVLEILSPGSFDLLKIILVISGIVLAALMVVFGIIELFRRGRRKKQAEPATA